MVGGPEESAGTGDVDGRLLFVPRQHPHPDPGLLQGFDGVGHVLLQPVHDARRPWTPQTGRESSIKREDEIREKGRRKRFSNQIEFPVRFYAVWFTVRCTETNMEDN